MKDCDFNTLKRTLQNETITKLIVNQADETGFDDDLEAIVWQRQLATLAVALIDHRYEAPFQENIVRARKTLRVTELGKQLLRAMISANVRFIHEQQNEVNDVHGYAPQVELIRNAFRASLGWSGREVAQLGVIEPFAFFPWHFHALSGQELFDAGHALNSLAKRLRGALLNSHMRESIKSFRRNATERHRHALRAARAAWEHHSKNLLIRLDWGYRRQMPHERYTFRSQDEFNTRCVEVSCYRKRMIKVLHDLFGTNLTFYLWKVECGDVKGLHIHWLIAVNGSAHQDRVGVARQIAEAWDRAINNPGCYTYNLNAKQDPERTMLRVLSYHDPDLPKALALYCAYLTKVDYTMKLRMPKGMRSFGCTRLRKSPKRKPGPARTRRMYEHEEINTARPLATPPSSGLQGGQHA